VSGTLINQGGSPALSGVIVNNRSKSVNIDLSKAFLVLLAGERAKPCSIWFDGCADSANQSCNASQFELGPSQSKEVRLGCSARGEFHLPIPASSPGGKDEIVAAFRLCKVSGIGRSCDTVR